LVKIQGILDSKQDRDKLSPIEVHDMVCHIADAVLAGGIRRAALISLFDLDDEEMCLCRHKKDVHKIRTTIDSSSENRNHAFLW
jgi:ribonucleoside-diphosphate reductase alpha chain